MLVRSSRLLSCGHYCHCKWLNLPASGCVKYPCFAASLRMNAVIQPNMLEAGTSLQNAREELQNPLMWPLSPLQVVKSSCISLREISLLCSLPQNQCSDPTKHAGSREQPPKCS